MTDRNQEAPPVRVSVGVATYPMHGESAEDLLEAADKLLYQMKRRNREIAAAAQS